MEPAGSAPQQLWQETGSRCTICSRPLSRPGTVAPPHGITAEQPNEGVVLPIVDGASTSSAQDAVLLCPFDAHNVARNRGQFPALELLRLKAAAIASQQERIQLTSEGRQRVRALAHHASFVGSTEPMVFIKVYNDSLSTPVRVDNITFVTDPPIVVQNRSRTLPAELSPGEMLETWQPLSALPPGPYDVRTLAAVTLHDGEVVISTPNYGVAQSGYVGGGGRALSDLFVNRDLLNDNPDTYDAFISHASEDKTEVATPLYEALTRRGLRVFYDQVGMGIGSSVSRSIASAMARSAFGIVVFSPAFLSKKWTMHELAGMKQLHIAGRQSLLPIWHNITFNELLDVDPSLADLLARSTADSTVEDIASEIAALVRPRG